ncbi:MULTISPECIES: alanine racemase [Alicyclobacillus]|uniref:alanine racemase n=1 Tax=Alicyclobacillus TaxID=29330 RepID=UPI001F1E5AE3|nr:MULTISPECIES: alanine racemase [Alicyclobacillus]
MDLGAIRHNADVIRELSGGAKIMAVLKRDAYGLGAVTIAQTLRACGVKAFAVDNAAEGIVLRTHGISEPILIIDGDIPDNASIAIDYNLIPGIAQDQLLKAYQDAALERRREVRIWLVYNVGFNRSGYKDLGEFAQFVTSVKNCSHLIADGIYAHLTNSNGDSKISWEQIKKFKDAVECAESILGRRIQTSLFASHGLVRWAKKFPTDWVRPGILLYGEDAFQDELIEEEALVAIGSLRPAIRLRTRIIHLLRFDKEEGVGYGQHHQARPGQCLATLSIGFGSGYPFISKDLNAIVHGKVVPVFGDIGMDAMQIDVTDVPDVQLYDWVTLIGKESGVRISVKELARRARTTPYQLLAGLKCERIYL